MPLLEADERDVKHRLTAMFMDTVETFKLLSENADNLFGDNGAEITNAIQECLDDFVFNVDGKERVHPESLIFNTDRVALQSAGFYGVQLALKERQVKEANAELRQSISARVRSAFQSPFKKWVGRINNFLGSLGVTGVGEALKELKDCMRDELPDD